MTDYVSGDMNSGERNTKINRLRHLGADERGILSNARCLSEGVDVPSLDGVAFIDPRKSQVDIVQAVGRAIRKSAGKTHGTIVIPVFIDAEENEQEALESSRFKPIWDVVNALRSHDDHLAQELDQLRISLGQRNSIGGKSGGLKNVVFDLPLMCEQSFVDGLRTVLVERTTSSWMFWFGLLHEYYDRSGHARILQTYKTSDGYALGSWSSNQRMRRALLPLDRIALLESLKGWSWDPLVDQWNDTYQALKEYVAENGNARPLSTFKTIDGFKLGGWVSAQRQNRESLAQDQIARLESLKGWSWDRRTDRWHDGYQALMEYVAQSGHARPPKQSNTTDGYALGDWVSIQRQKKGSLSQDRIDRLESLKGWSWDPHADQWNDGYEALIAYVAQSGDASPPANFKTTDGYALGGWIQAQRQKREALSQDRIARLDAVIGWSWDRLADRWNDGYAALREYVAQNGDARPPFGQKTTDGYAVGSWVSVQRKMRAILSQDQITRLESLKGWSWDPHTDQWNDGYQALMTYVAQMGDARTPQRQKTTDGYALGDWVAVQRHNRESLAPDQIARLESLKGWSWDPFVDQWNESYQALTEYVAQNGDARPTGKFKTKEGFKLGDWVSIQRQKKGSLSQDRIDRLESLKGWSWDPHADQWNDGYEALIAYVAQSGDAKPPRSLKTSTGLLLGAWISNQRTRRDSLSQDRIARLESLNGWSWGPKVNQTPKDTP
jgi:hypothetical protein